MLNNMRSSEVGVLNLTSLYRSICGCGACPSQGVLLSEKVNLILFSVSSNDKVWIYIEDVVVL
jgi:hypothetical protein